MTKKVSKPNKTRPKIVLIVGSASSTLDETPWDNPDVEIWGLAWRKLQRCDVYFDMHPIGPGRKNVPPNYLKWLSDLKKPIFTQEKIANVRNSIRYPIEQVIEALGPKLDPYSSGDYFASSIGYMLGLAIIDVFEEIHMYGIDLITDSEYSYQRPNTEYLIGVARGLGKKVYIPPNAALCKFSHRYGYEKPPPEGIITTDMMKERIKEYDNKWQKAMAEFYTSDGARQESRQILEILAHKERGFSYKPGSKGRSNPDMIKKESEKSNETS